jgi:hypothetical protein
MESLKKFPASEEKTQKQLAIIHKILVPMILLGFPEDSLSILQNSIKLCEKTSFFQWLTLAWGGLGLAEAELANPAGGIEFVEQGLKIQREANIDWLPGGTASFFPDFLPLIILLVGVYFRVAKIIPRAISPMPVP